MKKYKLPVLNQKSETVILANGDFPSHDIPLSILHHADYIVCCDGAINNLSKTNITPNAIVGDCDSLSEDNIQRFSDIIYRIKEQDTNDLTKAIHFCIKQGRKNITILGATGKREDHTIGNISLLWEYMEIAEVEMITDYGIFKAIDKPSVFESKKGQQVSLFSLKPSPINSRNLLYPLKDYILSNWWQGTLNESAGEEFIIETRTKTVVYRLFEIK
jgi:thiamine pyrophosphokinase